jgi:MoaA/NifB/PqqE/SkfB family radical SAM enzyme
MKKFICKHPWAHFEVNNPNGDVTMCCNNNTVLGNVNENTVAEIWNGDGFQASRKRMQDEGAYAMCPHTCPVLQGGKKYENLDWYTDLSEDSEQYTNAVLNEEEFATGQTALKSEPRWFRFTYSYACNLDCYHCYQREDAKMRIKLPDSFMDQARDYARTSQVVFPFGGEPFYFKPVLDFLESHNANLETRFYFITNATLLTERVYETLERLPITCMAASLDAATERSFDVLRVRGKNAAWSTAVENLEKLRELKKKKGFQFTVSMTVNSVNFEEIDSFVDLALGVDAEPLLLLVANPYQGVEFQKEFMHFTEQQFMIMFRDIESALKKVRDRDMEDAIILLEQLRTVLKQHRETDNNLVRFRAKNVARKAFHFLPEQIQIPIRKAVQKSRTKAFDKFAQGK